ncbi:MAG: hypothetical protein KME14_19095 [Tildeniella torsiva UHER 1998/13D]|jgi:hypothetical protein|nr:hypothetical protein [Tildeniella torsiva UHER 1998/13D]
MSPTLQRVIRELKMLSSEEQWTLLSYLVSQLQMKASLLKHPSPAGPSSDDTLEIDRLLKETSGSWGNLSVEEIDAEMDRQRAFSWGE